MSEELLNENVSIDDMDIDNVDLSDVDAIDDMDLSNFGEIDDTIEFPHFKLTSVEFKEVLKLAKVVCSTGGRDIISKAIMFKAEGSNLVAKATDLDVFVEKKVSLLNNENVLTDTVVVPTDILVKLAKAVPVNTVIYKKEDIFYIRLYGGDIPLETYSITEDKFSFNEPLAKSSTISLEVLKSVVKDFSPIVTSAVNPPERRILFSKETAFSSYAWALIAFKDTFDNFDLKVKDINVIKSLLVNKEGDLEVSFTTESDIKRCQFKGDDFTYTFLLSESTLTEEQMSGTDKVDSSKGVYVDFIQFYKMVEVSADLPYSIGKLGFKYSDTGLSLFLKTKKDKDSEFTLHGSPDNNPTYDKELILQAKLLRIVLRSFAGRATLKVSLDDNGIAISSGDMKAVLLADSLGEE